MNVSLRVALFMALSHGALAWAAPELQVQFHMGTGNGVTQQVGGTLANTGDAPISQGYLVVTPVDDHCHPGLSVLQSFGRLMPGDTQQFSIPVRERFVRYSLQMGAFDEQGFAVPASDANQVVLDSRLNEEREQCKQAEKR